MPKDICDSIHLLIIGLSLFEATIASWLFIVERREKLRERISIKLAYKNIHETLVESITKLRGLGNQIHYEIDKKELINKLTDIISKFTDTMYLVALFSEDYAQIRRALLYIKDNPNLAFEYIDILKILYSSLKSRKDSKWINLRLIVYEILMLHNVII
jgi:hypothetical protein